DRAVAVLDAVLAEDLEGVGLPGAGDAEDADLLRRVMAGLDYALDDAAGDDIRAGVRDDVHDDGDPIDAGLAEDELRQLHRFLDARVAAYLAVVGWLAAVLLDGVEDRQRAATGADDEPEVTVELDDAARDAAVVDGVDLRAPNLELRRWAPLACLVRLDAQLVEDGLVTLAVLVLHVEMAIEHDERAVFELAERIDLGKRHIVLLEQSHELRRDAR